MRGDTRDRVAAALGISGRTYEKAKEAARIVAADPEKNADDLHPLAAVQVEPPAPDVGGPEDRPSLAPAVLVQVHRLHGEEGRDHETAGDVPGAVDRKAVEIDRQRGEGGED